MKLRPFVSGALTAGILGGLFFEMGPELGTRVVLLAAMGASAFLATIFELATRDEPATRVVDPRGRFGRNRPL